jgi:allophanate hydrolase subunit 2
MSELFSFEQKGLTRFRGSPLYGSQDVGISPKGPMDRLAVLSGNIMLGNDDFQETLEIIFPPVLKCSEDFLFVLTGAHRSCTLVTDKGDFDIPNGTVSLAPRGATLVFSDSTKGFRSILSFRSADEIKDIHHFTGRSRGNFNQIFTFFDRKRTIRVLKGPEYSRLINPDVFMAQPWIISSDSNEMGYRLEPGGKLEVDSRDMISDVVCDGTVQLTPSGPIILLYHRQTVGGYPRIFNVISSDIDLLSQFSPGESVQFSLISPEEAVDINSKKAGDIALFRSRFSSIK